MKTIKLSVLMLGIAAVLGGCSKKTDTPPQPAVSTEAPSCCQAQNAEGKTECCATVPQEPAAAPAPAQEELAPIPLTLPKPMFVGTPQNLEGVTNLEPPLGKDRPPFLAPKGVTNVALNKPVTASESMPFMGELPMIVDGDKDATDGSVVELGPFAQWVTIDLEKEYEIYAIVVWHFHRTPSVYFDVAVQVSKDPEFIDAATVFNNDIDNTLGLGAGADMNYVETAEGKLIDAKGVTGRYVKLWSRGNNQNDYNHYIEVEVYAR